MKWAPVTVGGGNALSVVCMAHSAIPEAAGLFNPENDKDACGVGFVGELSKQPSRKCVTDALKMLARMTHRGACGCEENTGNMLLDNILPWRGALRWWRGTATLAAQRDRLSRDNGMLSYLLTKLRHLLQVMEQACLQPSRIRFSSMY